MRNAQQCSAMFCNARQMGNYAQQSAMRGKSQQYLLTLLSNASAAQLNWNSTYHNQQQQSIPAPKSRLPNPPKSFGYSY